MSSTCCCQQHTRAAVDSHDVVRILGRPACVDIIALVNTGFRSLWACSYVSVENTDVIQDIVPGGRSCRT